MVAFLFAGPSFRPITDSATTPLPTQVKQGQQDPHLLGPLERSHEFSLGLHTDICYLGKGAGFQVLSAQ